METMNKNLIFFILFLFFSSGCRSIEQIPYEYQQFSIEPFTAYDSIMDTYADNFEGDRIEVNKGLRRNFLITGYSDPVATEHKIDSILPYIIDTNYIHKNYYWIRIYKKTWWCNNNYVYQDREFIEINDNEYLFLDYNYKDYYEEKDDIISIIKNRNYISDTSAQVYHLVWNLKLTDPDTAWISRTRITNIPKNERSPGMEAWFDSAVGKAQARLKKLKGLTDVEGTKRYLLR